MPPEQKLSVTLPTGMHPYYGNMAKLHASREQSEGKGHEPFDWLTGAVADFTFNQSGATSGDISNTQSDKSSSLASANVMASPKHSNETLQQTNCELGGGARAKTTSPPSRDLYGQVGNNQRNQRETETAGRACPKI